MSILNFWKFGASLLDVFLRSWLPFQVLLPLRLRTNGYPKDFSGGEQLTTIGV